MTLEKQWNKERLVYWDDHYYIFDFRKLDIVVLQSVFDSYT